MELRGHDHVVECAIFAPIAAYAAIRELAGIVVSFSSLKAQDVVLLCSRAEMDRSVAS